MENKAANHSFSNNGHSLQLRSKDVSEVMGNIPEWIGSWGTFLICLFFFISIIFIFNIRAVQRVRGKAMIGRQQAGILQRKEKECSLQVVISNAEAGKIKKGQQVVIFPAEKNTYLSNLNGKTFLVYDVKNNNDSYILQLSLTDDFKDSIILDKNITYTSVDCQIETNFHVYKRIFGSLF